MKKTNVSFQFMDKTYQAEVEYFEPPDVMPYYKAIVSDQDLLKEFGMVHNFKEKTKNGWIVLEPAIEPQGKFHSYFWTCLMSALYILLLNDESNLARPPIS